MDQLDEHPLAAGIRWQNQRWPQLTSSIGDLEEGWTSAAALADPRSSLLAELLEYQTRFQRGVDPRTQAAYLISYLGNLVSAAVIVPLLKSSVVADFTPPVLACRFDDYPDEFRGQTVQMKRASIRFLTGRCWTDEIEKCAWPDMSVLSDRASLREKLRAMIEDHFAPLIETLAGMTRLSRAAQWRLVGDCVSAVFLETGKLLDIEETAKADAMAVLKVPGSPLNNAQLHYFDLPIPVGPGPDAPVEIRSFRARGGCCRYYLTEGGHLCTSCVLEKPAERNRRIREAALKRLAQPAMA